MSWTDPEVVLVDDDNKLRLVYLHDTRDTQEFGSRMGHCAGHHQFMVKAGLWHFWTVLDEGGDPHISIHARTVNSQSDDTLKKMYRELGFTGKAETVYPTWEGCYSGHGPDKRYFHMYDYSSTVPSWAKELVSNPEAPPAPEKGTAEYYTWMSKWPKVTGSKPFMWRDTPCIILSSYVRGQYGAVDGTPGAKYDALAKKLFKERVIKDAPPVVPQYQY